MATIPRAHAVTPGGKSRARGFEIPFDGEPGHDNAITDVPGVTVGYRTLISGEGRRVAGQGPIRTGVTAILPRPRAELATPIFAGICSLNGNGELTGSHLIEEVGAFNFPVTITNTHSCGVARDATLAWMRKILPGALDSTWGLPVAAETSDSFLNDIDGQHVSAEHVFEALETAEGGVMEEGSVGGGTGMVAFGFKAGSGTASRMVEHGGLRFTLGAFVQANFGRRHNLTIRGIRAGRELSEPAMIERTPIVEKSSIIGIVATDAPLLPHQLKRIASRMPLGVALTGGYGYNSSGDIFLAFSTANANTAFVERGRLASANFIPDTEIDRFFDASIQATEEAILNALIANADMTGRDGNFVPALPHAWLERTFGRRS